MIKIFLHVSKKEQQRLIDRIINKQKNWKFSVSDITERKYWDEYQRIYGEMISRHLPIMHRGILYLQIISGLPGMW